MLLSSRLWQGMHGIRLGALPNDLKRNSDVAKNERGEEMTTTTTMREDVVLMKNTFSVDPFLRQYNMHTMCHMCDEDINH